MTDRDDKRSRDYDLVLFGAGGFVGRQTVQYIATHPRAGQRPQGLRWAIAGHRRETLEAARAAAGAPANLDLVVVDGGDEAALGALASRTRVMLSTAGPFALYSDTMVSACVRQRTDYVDITGETPWVRSLIDRHHLQAAVDGTRIVPCCGFDSVPSDLGVLLAVRQLQRTTASPCREAKGFFQLRGGINGGTVATAVYLRDSGQAAQAADPFVLSPGLKDLPGALDRSRDPTGVHLDGDVQAWVGPHVMGPINTRVVRRSAALFAEWGQPYGNEFGYQEYARYGSGLAGRMKAGLVTGGLALFERGLGHPTVRRALRRALPRPGAGPSEKVMDTGWFRCEVVARAPDGRRARVLITHQGDPGNRATVRFVCEAALCLTEPRQTAAGPLRDAAATRGGILTPATAFGEPLAARLRAAGVNIDIIAEA